jgi:hypothetical protein
MSTLFQNLRIVEVEYMSDEKDEMSTVQLGIESDCPFQLATTTAIPYVAEVIAQVQAEQESQRQSPITFPTSSIRLCPI